MPQISTIELLKKGPQPILSIRRTTSVDKLPMLISESFAKLSAYLKQLGETLSDVPFVAYHNMDMDNLDVEIGFPLAYPLPSSGEIASGLLPGGEQIFSLFRGDYSKMEPAYQQMYQWLEQNGRKSTGVTYESYFNGPEFGEEELLTMISMPLSDA